MSAFVETVVPWTMRWVSASSRPASRPSASASATTPSITPMDGSAGVDAAFAMVTRPASSTATASVKVPPTSIPIRYTSALPPRVPLSETRGALRPPLCGCGGDEPVDRIGRPSRCRAKPRRPPTTASARLDAQDVARADLDPDFLGLQQPVLAPARGQHVAMRQTIGAAHQPAGSVAGAVSGRVALRRKGDLDDHLHRASGSAAVTAVPARPGAKLVALEEEREPHLGDL